MGKVVVLFLLLKESMSMISYEEMVGTLTKPGNQILEEITAHDCNLVHMAMGISGEAGELLDAIKKHVIYRKPLDRYNVLEELGDIEFFLEGLRQALNISREETLQLNMEKLGTRYKDFQYSNEQAVTRADKGE